MIKLKQLLKEDKFWNRKFGEPLPTLEDTMNRHNGKVNEDTAKDWKKVQKLLDEIRTNLSELVKYGADYGVFQDAKYASKTLKKAWRDISRIT